MLARRESGKMLAARVARHSGSPVSSRPQSQVMLPSVATCAPAQHQLSATDYSHPGGVEHCDFLLP